MQKKGKIMGKLVLTKKWNKICSSIITEVSILIGEKLFTINAEWDTGATKSSISKELIQELQLKSIKKDEVITTIGIEKKDVYNIDIVLKDDSDILIPLEVTVGDNLRQTGIDMLIGMDVIHFGDFVISNYDGKTCFSFRYPSEGLIDFTK